MSTNLKAPNGSYEQRIDDGAKEAQEKKVLDLSLTQVVGGALAAMTAAALGSTLGVGGTIAGAALASVVAGVAGSLYTASLRTGREKVRTVFRGGTDAATAPPAPIDPTTTVTATGRAIEETQVLPVWDPLPLEQPSRARTSAGRTSSGAKARARSAGGFPWKRAVAISLSVFALAAVLITGYERVSGQPLSGGSGTTVSQVRSDTPSSDNKDSSGSDSTPSPSAPSSSPSATETESTQPSAEPSATESESPSASPSESQPTATPSTDAGAAAQSGAALPAG